MAASAKPANNQIGYPLLFAGDADGSLLTAKPKLLTDRYIYVIEKRPSAPAKLAVELRALPSGELWVGPANRRHKERVPPERDMFDATSSLNWSVQGEGISYFFFASPTRLLAACDRDARIHVRHRGLRQSSGWTSRSPYQDGTSSSLMARPRPWWSSPIR